LLLILTHKFTIFASLPVASKGSFLPNKSKLYKHPIK